MQEPHHSLLQKTAPAVHCYCRHSVLHTLLPSRLDISSNLPISYNYKKTKQNKEQVQKQAGSRLQVTTSLNFLLCASPNASLFPCSRSEYQDLFSYMLSKNQSSDQSQILQLSLMCTWHPGLL